METTPWRAGVRGYEVPLGRTDPGPARHGRTGGPRQGSHARHHANRERRAGIGARPVRVGRDGAVGVYVWSEKSPTTKGLNGLLPDLAVNSR